MILDKLKLVNKKVISTIDIKKNTPICEFQGAMYNEGVTPESNDALQIYHNIYMGYSGKIYDHIRHSCSPNCFVSIIGKRAVLYSLYDIKKNMEITFDYSTTSTESLDQWSMKCNCGSYNCRKIISGIQSLDTKTIEEYKKKNMIPLFITNKIFGKI